MIPSRAQSFQDRAEAGQLRAAVDDDAVSCQVLTGMGGVGKTQLAADYAHTAWGNGGLDVLVWVTATSRPSVVASYAQVGVELCGADPKDPDRAARAFLAWLTPKAGQTPCRWLIVLDDIADPGDLNATSEDPDSRHSLWPPASPHGRTLATTRRRDAALTRNARPPIKVGLFTPDEAATYLTTSLAAHSRNEPADYLATLARDLGRLPLALSQATAYIIDAAIPVDCVPCPHDEGECPSYRALLADRVTALVDLAPDVLPDEQGVALAAAWSLSIERADRLRPVGLARPMLQLAALLDANGIPQDVLTGEAARGHLAAHRIATSPCPAEEPALVSRQDTVRALRALDRLSLIAHTSDTPHKTVRVHQLIQRATRDTLTPDQRVHHARTAADALRAAWPETEHDSTLAQVLRANTDALTRHAEDALWYPDAHAVLFRAGESLGRSGQVADAVSHALYLAETARQRLGPDHPDALIARNNLAYWRGEAGDPAGAADAFADLLSDRTRILGWSHPHTLDTVVNLSHWQARAGHTRSAGLSFFAFYGVCLDKLGPEHPRTRSALSHLATWLDESGNLAGAADMFAELVEICLRTVGPDDLETLSARKNLARVRGRRGIRPGPSVPSPNSSPTVCAP